MDDNRRQILKAAAALLEQVEGEVPTAFTIRIKTPDSTIFIQPRQDELAIGELPEAQQLILDQFLPGQILTSDQVAKLTGYKPGGRFRGHLASLKKLGFLEVTETGYKRAPAPGQVVSGGRDTDGEKSDTRVSSTRDNPDD